MCQHLPVELRAGFDRADRRLEQCALVCPCSARWIYPVEHCGVFSALAFAQLGALAFAQLGALALAHTSSLT